jgi:pimeloyl-ACP methyl ester carboxylesterase
MKILREIRCHISLAYIKNDYQKKRNMIIHHGLMGSSKNFKSLSKTSSISNYVNTYLIDCRNHGESPYTNTHSMEDLADDMYDFIH